MLESNALRELLQEGVEQFSTPLDWIRGAASLFEAFELCYGHGTDNAWDEACFLVQDTLRLKTPDFERATQAKLFHLERQAIAERIRQRIETRIPLPYLLNKAYFGNLLFYVDERVLIPRSPFAEWIEKRFEPFLRTEPQRIAELCTGSGCIAVLLAEYFPEAQIDASDLSPDALVVAQKNVDDYGLSDRITLIQSDVWSDFGDQTYDLIVANPPYVPHEEYTQLPMEFLHEPQLALVAGETGLDIVFRILEASADHLNPEGLLVIEMGQSRELFLEIFPQGLGVELSCERGGDGLFCFTREELLSLPGK